MANYRSKSANDLYSSMSLPFVNYTQFAGNDHEFNPINFEFGAMNPYYSPQLIGNSSTYLYAHIFIYAYLS